MTEAIQRRLAAVLAADVAGYSRLMGEDEAGTLSALRNLRTKTFVPIVDQHQGVIVKSMGDGWLVEFASVADAVNCAIEIQEKLAEEKNIKLRVGVHLGDITHEEEDIFGDGVNIAARLQEIAQPGGIVISDIARRSIDGRLAAAFVDLGVHNLKNIAEPITAFGWGTTTGATDTAALPLPDKPSIAVLPFENMSGDSEQEVFADGITEDLITDLSKIRWFFVIARNSTFTYKGQAIEVRQVSRQLGVRYVLEGSVRRSGGRVRISAQLIDATTGSHVWAERYDREIEDIFELQDEMTRTIVAAVEPELGAFERERALRTPPQNLDAWKTYQRGLWHMWSFTRQDNEEALPLLRRARELDPNFSSAYAYEGYSHFLNVILGYTDTPGESLKAALTAAKKAVALDDKDPAAYLTLGRVYMMLGEHDTSIAELEKSLSLNPNFAPAYFGLGFALALAGRYDEALKSLDNAMRLNPRDPLMWAIKTICSLTHNLLHKHDIAAEWARQAIREPRATSFWPYAALASALGNLDQIEEAQTAIDQARQQKPDLSLSYLEKTLATKQPGKLQPYLDGLRKAGLPE